MRKGVLLVVYTNVSGGQNMVSRFCKRFLFYSRIIVYTISRIVPESVVMMRVAILEIYSIFYLPEVRHFQFAKLYNCRTSSAEWKKRFTYVGK